MVSTFTPNIQLEEPARGDYVGTWDTPVNNNMTLIDLRAGGTVTIALNNSPVVLAAAQFQASHIVFNSTLTGSVTITFPTSFVGPYVVENVCTGSSAFVITLTTTNPGGNFIGLKPGEPCDVFNDGASIKYRNLGNIGSYWDYAGSSVPAWVTACAIPPYLACSGGTFSATTYPLLAVILGSTTLPDSRGRFRATLNQGTTRLTTAAQGLDGNTNFAAGSGITLTSSFIPTLTSVNAAQAISVTTTVNSLAYGFTTGAVLTNNGGAYYGAGALTQMTIGAVTATGNNSISVAYTNSSQATLAVAPPSYVGGITMIRAG